MAVAEAVSIGASLFTRIIYLKSAPARSGAQAATVAILANNRPDAITPNTRLDLLLTVSLHCATTHAG